MALALGRFALRLAGRVSGHECRRRPAGEFNDGRRKLQWVCPLSRMLKLSFAQASNPSSTWSTYVWTVPANLSIWDPNLPFFFTASPLISTPSVVSGLPSLQGLPAASVAPATVGAVHAVSDTFTITPANPLLQIVQVSSGVE